MKVSVQKSVGFLRFSNFVKFAKQKEKPAQMPGFLSKFTGGSGWIRTTSVVRQQIYSLPRLSNSGARPISQELLLSFLVRAAGIEPAFQAWKACILALELCSQRFSSPLIISYFFINASIYSATSTESIYLRETFSIFTGLYSSFETVSFSSLA